jgi:hypothetical protein
MMNHQPCSQSKLDNKMQRHGFKQIKKMYKHNSLAGNPHLVGHSHGKIDRHVAGRLGVFLTSFKKGIYLFSRLVLHTREDAEKEKWTLK